MFCVCWMDVLWNLILVFFGGYYLRIFMFIVFFVVSGFLHFFCFLSIDRFGGYVFFYTVWCSLVVQVSCCLKGFLITLRNSEISLEGGSCYTLVN